LASHGDFHAAPQIGHFGFERQRRPPLRHRLHIATDTEGAARAFKQNGADLMVLGRAPRRLDQTLRHVRIERVAPIRAVHGDGEQAGVEFLQDDVVHCWFLIVVIRCVSAPSLRAKRSR